MEELNNNTGAVESAETDAKETPKTFTQEEVDKMLQAETDRRVTQALKKQAEKNKLEVKEAEKLARMNETEKYQYELEQREKAIELKEKELALAENKNEASKILAEKGLSLELVDFVVNESAETMNANIKLLEKAFKSSVKNEVEKRMGSSVPKKDLPLDTTITKDVFNKMSIREQSKLAKENPEIYKTLTQF